MRSVKVSLPDELHDRLVAEARRTDRSVSAVIRSAVRKGLGLRGDYPTPTGKEDGQ